MNFESQKEQLRANLPRIRKIVARIAGKHGSVDDIVQECCVQILVKGELYREQGKLEQWTNALTRNLTLNFLSRQKRARKKEEEMLNEPVVSQEVTNDFSEEQISWVLQQIPSLPPTQKEILRLRYFEGKKVSEIAERLGVSHQAISKQLERALKSLRHRAQAAHFLAALLPWNWDFSTLWKAGTMGIKTKIAVTAGVAGTLFFGVSDYQKSEEIAQLHGALDNALLAVAHAKPSETSKVSEPLLTENSSPTPIAKEREELPSIPAVAKPVDQDIPLFSPALMKYAEEKMLEGWKKERPDQPSNEELTTGLADFQKQTLALPAIIGRDRARTANLDDDLRQALSNGDGVALLKAAKKHRFQMPQKGFNEWMDKCFTVRTSGVIRNGENIQRSTDLNLQDGETIVFGAGVFKLDAQQLEPRDSHPYPTDLTIQGAGKDSTLLRMSDIRSRTDINRLTIRDLTLDSNCSCFDVRGPALVVRLENVRIVGFDCGAGGSVAIESNGGAVLKATNCDFVGGYGRNPEGYGNLFRGTPLFALFSSCRFESIDLNLNQMSDGGMANFINCIITPRSEKLDKFSEKPPKNVSFLNCYINPPASGAMKEKKDLSELFPQLKK